MSHISYTQIESPLGEIVACATDRGICFLNFSEGKHNELQLKQIEKEFNAKLKEEDSEFFCQLRKELNLYFAGKLKQFSVQLDMIGTDFQRKVWDSLKQIPYGETRTYMQQSVTLGNPKAIRAVANANGKNKISIVIPCHRVIGSDGKMTGYAGGVWRKEKLLGLEKGSIRF
ncbi:methylated-DNA--[protein]-cysteine S-methyltransferase [Dysgonomonas sp. 520]|uniref:methylated-DNA--[protein]-cysteine S-methyltransferase n=1 Tax=Dysgonomonas sp. 520 TaxID=2302931 RepID=UPI0013D6D8FD|nr:methylated-DNA--[protein]-cysteine S-methyltransferase [Dysgonomonas sp. 520]NDW08111.1 methylated-DNA--[protein]-cysteine S-methyltransferase [Dysgonomonas sp. 520]